MRGAGLFACRLVLAAVFLVAGFDKVGHPERFAEELTAYRMVPSSLVTLVALALPRLEILAGAFMAAGFLTASSGLLLGALAALFAGAVGWAAWWGRDIACGCLTLVSSSVGWGHVAIDLLLLAMACAVLRGGPGPAAVDGFLACPTRNIRSKGDA